MSRSADVVRGAGYRWVLLLEAALLLLGFAAFVALGAIGTVHQNLHYFAAADLAVAATFGLASLRFLYSISTGRLAPELPERFRRRSEPVPRTRVVSLFAMLAAAVMATSFFLRSMEDLVEFRGQAFVLTLFLPVVAMALLSAGLVSSRLRSKG